ncbi:MAG: ADP-ribosylglycohydrolase family protein, partial [Dehalococcoidia bacterium]|nr:ADP-ribosylglycohydrolase family protein [Dehalococcoidia bacterium]
GNGIEALNSVPTAIYCFLKQPKSYKDSVIYAISLGGDTDTIASMAGAISGAYLGVEAIPQEWRLKLENKAYIEDLAEKLWQTAT